MTESNRGMTKSIYQRNDTLFWAYHRTRFSELTTEDAFLSPPQNRNARFWAYHRNSVQFWACSKTDRWNRRQCNVIRTLRYEKSTPLFAFMRSLIHVVIDMWSYRMISMCRVASCGFWRNLKFPWWDGSNFLRLRFGFNRRGTVEPEDFPHNVIVPDTHVRALSPRLLSDDHAFNLDNLIIWTWRTPSGGRTRTPASSNLPSRMIIDSKRQLSEHGHPTTFANSFFVERFLRGEGLGIVCRRPRVRLRHGLSGALAATASCRTSTRSWVLTTYASLLTLKVHFEDQLWRVTLNMPTYGCFGIPLEVLKFNPKLRSRFRNSIRSSSRGFEIRPEVRLRFSTR